MTDNGSPIGRASTTRLRIAGRSFRSRLMLGTGKYRNPETMAACHRESRAEIITVAVRQTAQIAVELAGSIVGHERWREISITPGATLEIVRFVGGG